MCIMKKQSDLVKSISAAVYKYLLMSGIRRVMGKKLFDSNCFAFLEVANVSILDHVSFWKILFLKTCIKLHLFCKCIIFFLNFCNLNAILDRYLPVETFHGVRILIYGLAEGQPPVEVRSVSNGRSFNFFFFFSWYAWISRVHKITLHFSSLESNYFHWL